MTYSQPAPPVNGIVASDGSLISPAFTAYGISCLDASLDLRPAYQSDYPGSKFFLVAVGDDGEVSAPETFTLLPLPTLRATTQSEVYHGMYNAGKGGDTITLSGSNWEPNESITLTLTDTSVPDVMYDLTGATPVRFASPTPLSVTTNSLGIFAAPFILPASLPWGHQAIFTATGTGPLFGTLSATAEFFTVPAITPTLAVVKPYVILGSTLTVIGDHWNPGETFAIGYCSGDLHNGPPPRWPFCSDGSSMQRQLGMVTVDSGGHLRQQVTIPADARLGIITIEVDAGVPEIAVQVVSHAPTWLDEHASLVPAIIASSLAALAAVAVGVSLRIRQRRRDRRRQRRRLAREALSSSGH
ncbi:MAG TPA: hypothetical protein VF807_14435 [Ktedonobacterales bacterium]